MTTQYASRPLFSNGQYNGSRADLPEIEVEEDRDAEQVAQPELPTLEVQADRYDGTALYKLARSLGRKFDARDIAADEKLAETAEWYTREVYKGDPAFAESFMRDIQRAQRQYGRLTPAQAKGVLNVAVAAFRTYLESRERKAEQPERKIAAYTPLPNGYYTVVTDGKHLTFKLSQDKKRERQYAAVLVGADNLSDYATFGTVDTDGNLSVWKSAGSYGSERRYTVAASWVTALSELLSGALDREQAGQTYALESGRCRRCGRMLTVPASIHQGYGPECIKYV